MNSTIIAIVQVIAVFIAMTLAYREGQRIEKLKQKHKEEIVEESIRTMIEKDKEENRHG